MNIIIDINNYKICFDPYGNLYFEELNNYIDPTTYQINVDKNNMPYFDSGNYDIIEKAIINKNPINIEEDIPNDDNNDKPIYDVTHDYVIEMGDDWEEALCEDNPKFDFECNIDNFCDERENGDVSALYDTEIYDANNNLIVRSTSSDMGSIYNLKIYLDGRATFNCKSYTPILYKISLNESKKLMFILDK